MSHGFLDNVFTWSSAAPRMCKYIVLTLACAGANMRSAAVASCSCSSELLRLVPFHSEWRRLQFQLLTSQKSNKSYSLHMQMLCVHLLNHFFL